MEFAKKYYLISGPFSSRSLIAARILSPNQPANQPSILHYLLDQTMENVLKSLLLSSTSTADSSDFFKADEEDVHPQHSSPPLSSLTSFTRLDIGLNRLMRLAAIVAPPASSSTTEVPSLQGGCLAVIPDPFSHVRNHPLIFNNLSWHSIHRTLITGNLNSILLMSPLTPSSLDTNTRLIVEALLLLLIYLARQFGIRDAGNQIDAMITGILTKVRNTNLA